MQERLVIVLAQVEQDLPLGRVERVFVFVHRGLVVSLTNSFPQRVGAERVLRNGHLVGPGVLGVAFLVELLYPWIVQRWLPSLDECHLVCLCLLFGCACLKHDGAEVEVAACVFPPS